jgi:Peptidase_C39 like family
MSRRRGLLRGSVLLLCLSALQPMTALAGGGPDKAGVGGAPANDTQDSVFTPEDAAKYAQKVAAAATVEDYLLASATSGGSTTASKGSGATPYIICPDGCGGTGDAPPVEKVLATKPRQQSTWYWCGPASGQVVINWSRGYTSSSLDGDSSTSNYKKQSTLASLMGTNSTSGTGGAALATTLNRDDTVDPPTADWIYSYVDSGTMLDLHTKIVTDVAEYGMPLVAGVAPHVSGSPYALSSWGNYSGNAHHYIVLSGYSGLIPSSALITYDDSSKGYSGGTGKFEDPMTTIWNVNKNNKAKIIW